MPDAAVASFSRMGEMRVASVSEPKVAAQRRRAAVDRALAALLTATLLVTMFVPSVAAAPAGSLSPRIAAVRHGQIASESVMRKQDRKLERLKLERKDVVKQNRRTKRKVKRTATARAQGRRVVSDRAAHLDRLLDEFLDQVPGEPTDDPGLPSPDPGAEPPPAEPAEPAAITRARKELQGAQKDLRQLDRKMARVQRSRKKRKRQLGRIHRHISHAVALREGAEASLAAYIGSMTQLAQQRASIQSDVNLGDDEAFAWPAAGGITQPYGCTGFRSNSRRGGCRHFHDGIDISPSGGIAIRAATDGVVAYVGWNPWDKGERAFIVVIGHRGGLVTRYGHLLPNRRIRAGQLVTTGEVVGRMGSTGNSTGTHLHLELLDRTGPRDPLAYLPSREGSSDTGAEDARNGRRRGARPAPPERTRPARTRPVPTEAPAETAPVDEDDDEEACATDIATQRELARLGGDWDLVLELTAQLALSEDAPCAVTEVEASPEAEGPAAEETPEPAIPGPFS